MSRIITRGFVVKWVPAFVLFALVLAFAMIEPRFFSVRNFARIAISASPALMVAIGVTFIIIMGSIDLSMEGTVLVCAVVFAFAFWPWAEQWPAWLGPLCPWPLSSGQLLD